MTKANPRPLLGECLHIDCGLFKKMEPGHFSRNLALVFLIALASVAGVIYLEVQGLNGCCHPAAVPTIPPDSVSCSLGSRSCTMTIFNKGSNSFSAVSCAFEVKGANTSGTLAHEPGGVPTSIEIFPDSNVAGYCSDYPGAPELGVLVTGTVQFSDGSQTTFEGIWR